MESLMESRMESKLSVQKNQGLTVKLPTKKYSIIYADPPWDYKGQLQYTTPKGPKHTHTNDHNDLTTKGAAVHYPTVPVKLMKTWDIPSICKPDCLLFMWTSSPHLDQAIDLGKAWGFDYATVAFVWDKMRPNPGFYTMSSTELCLVFKRGRIPKPRGSRNQRQYLAEKRTRHSAKPAEIRNRIKRMFPRQSKLEMFAREKTPGWDVWGNDSKVVSRLPTTNRNEKKTTKNSKSKRRSTKRRRKSTRRKRRSVRRKRR